MAPRETPLEPSHSEEKVERPELSQQLGPFLSTLGNYQFHETYQDVKVKFVDDDEIEDRRESQQVRIKRGTRFIIFDAGEPSRAKEEGQIKNGRYAIKVFPKGNSDAELLSYQLRIDDESALELMKYREKRESRNTQINDDTKIGDERKKALAHPHVTPRFRRTDGDEERIRLTFRALNREINLPKQNVLVPEDQNLQQRVDDLERQFVSFQSGAKSLVMLVSFFDGKNRELMYALKRRRENNSNHQEISQLEERLRSMGEQVYELYIEYRFDELHLAMDGITSVDTLFAYADSIKNSMRKVEKFNPGNAKLSDWKRRYQELKNRCRVQFEAILATLVGELQKDIKVLDKDINNPRKLEVFASRIDSIVESIQDLEFEEYKPEAIQELKVRFAKIIAKKRTYQLPPARTVEEIPEGGFLSEYAQQMAQNVARLVETGQF